MPRPNLMTPGIRPGALPPFYELGEYVFQDLCRDLLHEEPEIVTCEVYGTRGQHQHGIDLLAYRRSAAGSEVGQCKCYPDFPPKLIRDASDEFFAHWDNHWSTQEVKRFVLFVAGDLSQRQRQEEIMQQKQRFAAVGIVYEAWSASDIRNKLGPHKRIVATYCVPPEYWVRVICGEVSTLGPWGNNSAPAASDVVQTLLTSQLEQMVALLSDKTARELTAMRDAWHEGRTAEVRDWLAGLRANATYWAALAPPVKADVLRFEAGMDLTLTNDTRRARQLATEAHALAPSERGLRLEAIITYKEAGAQAALGMLEAPLDRDSRNLQAMLLLELGQFEACAAAYADDAATDAPNAETYRVRALAALAVRDISRSQQAIDQAVALAPNWEQIRFSAAVIDYCSALSPAAVLPALSPWPEPIEWALVKRDDESLSRLRRAADIFRILAGAAVTHRQELQTWHLACLANDPERQEAASAYAQTLLHADSTDFRAIAWTLARGFTIDLRPIEQALNRQIDAGNAIIPHVLALVNCYLANARLRHALKLIQRTRPLFQRVGADDRWEFLHAQIQLFNAGRRGPLPDEDGAGVELRHALTLALRERAKRSGNWQTLLDHLDRSYAETDDPRFLLDRCEVLAQRGQWGAVASTADQLMVTLGTSAALSLAALALYNTRQFARCLELLESRQNLYPECKLPGQLRRIRAFCKRALGVVPEAIAEAEYLIVEDPSIENLVALLQLYLDIGDLQQLALTARPLLERDDVSTGQLLWIGRIIQVEFPDLARAFWHQACAQGIGDDAIGEAIELGSQLGLDGELQPLMVRLHELGQHGQGGIRRADAAEVIELVRQRQAFIAHLDELYRHGEAPSHALGEQLRVSLADWYHRQLATNEAAPAPLRQFPLLARHGGRTLMTGFPEQTPAWRLYLDITAVLLAAHADVLSAVEQAFRPLHIPSDLVAALIEQREHLLVHQPRLLEAHRQIVDLAEQGVLQLAAEDAPSDSDVAALGEMLGMAWIGLLSTARARGGALVAFLPPHGRNLQPVILPAEIQPHVIPPRAAVEALRLRGPLSAADYAEALRELGAEGQNPAGERIPGIDTPLFLAEGIAELLAGANVLQVLCERFQVTIHPHTLERARAELQDATTRRSTIDWLTALIGRLRQGIVNRTYSLVPAPPDDDSDEARPATVRCMYALLQCQTQPGDVLWFDDRWVNGYLRRDSAPIIGISEVMKALVSAGALTIDEYYARLTRLRAANVRFLPLDEEEIRYHLAQAHVVDGVVVETHELVVLRRSIAACLVQHDILQYPPLTEGASNADGEQAFLRSLFHATTSGLSRVWSDDPDPIVCRARAEWILQNLYVDQRALQAISSLSTPADTSRYQMAVSLTALLFQGLMVLTAAETSQVDTYERYADWLFLRILSPRLIGAPDLVEAIGDMLKGTVRQLATGPSDRPVGELRMVLRQWFDGLPKPIRMVIEGDPECRALMGYTSVITLAGMQIDPAVFWHAVSEAVNGRPASLVTRDGQALTFTPALPVEDMHGFSFVHPITQEAEMVHDLAFSLLHEAPAERSTALRAHQLIFDYPDGEYQQLIDRIVTLGDPQQRVAELRSLERNSMVLYYAQLEQAFTAQTWVPVANLLPPGGAPLYRHFRLPSDVGPGTAFSSALTEAAHTLLRETDVLTALTRLCMFPVPLPAPILDAVTSLSSTARRGVIVSLISTTRTPVAAAHLLALLIRFQADAPAYIRLARRMIGRWMTDEAAAVFEVFRVVLTWVNDVFAYWTDTENWSPTVRLALVWAHTERIFGICLGIGIPPSWLEQTFRDPPLAHELFTEHQEYRSDIAHPRQVERLQFVIGTLLYGLGEHAPEWMAQGVGDRLAKIAFRDVGEMTIPAVPLLRDMSLAPDQLGVFFNGQPFERVGMLFGMENTDTPVGITPQGLIAHAVQTLTEQPLNEAGWGLLHAVLGDRPLPPDLFESLRNIIQQASFAELGTQHLSDRIPILMASQLIRYLRDIDLRRHVEGQMLQIVRAQAQRAAQEQPTAATQEMAGLFLEVARHLAHAQPEMIIAAFVDLLSQIIALWPAATPIYRGVLEQLCEELPIEQAKQLWPLFIRLRAAL